MEVDAVVKAANTSLILAGISRFPLKRCSDVMLRTAMEFAKKSNHPQTVIFCLYENTAFHVFQDTLDRLTAV